MVRICNKKADFSVAYRKTAFLLHIYIPTHRSVNFLSPSISPTTSYSLLSALPKQSMTTISSSTGIRFPF